MGFDLGDAVGPGADPQAEARAHWGRHRQQGQWRSIVLDADDPIGARAPRYFESADGWLERPGDDPHLIAETQHVFVLRNLGAGTPSMAMFVQTEEATGNLMARITVHADQTSSRRMQVHWNGAVIAEHDIASYFEQDRTLFVSLPGPHAPVTHELRIRPDDQGFVRVSQIMLAGPGNPRWARKPALPAGGRLEVISAYYMPDPLPPPDSQVVEGRHKKIEVGLNLQFMQRMYKEHADFGGLRIVVRNTGSAPVRIRHELRLNGRPIQEHYVDFKTSAWDARGVAWYRVRPRTVQPGQCAQVYVRFRRRPEGGAAMTIPVDGQEPVSVDVAYDGAGFAIDYVTTNAGYDTLYVYARRYDPASAAQLAQLTLDGKNLDWASLYGADFPGNIALFVSKLDRSLTPGDFHAVGVRTDGRQHVAAQFRVMRHFFPRTTIHTPIERAEALNMNLSMWHMRSLETCNKYDIDTTSGSDPTAVHERVAYILGPDEPDAHDNRGGGYAVGLGATARRLAHSAWQTRVERYAPRRRPHGSSPTAPRDPSTGVCTVRSPTSCASIRTR